MEHMQNLFQLGILIVDDEKDIRKACNLVLRKACYTNILFAEDGLECLNVMRARGEEVAVVLIDNAMPKISGMEAVKCLIGLHQYVVGVIYFTGKPSAQEAEYFLGLGNGRVLTTDYLLKPVTPEKFMSTIQKTLDLVQRTREGSLPTTSTPNTVRVLRSLASEKEHEYLRLDAAIELLKLGDADSGGPVLRELACDIGDREGKRRLRAAVALGQYGELEKLKMLAYDPTVRPVIREEARVAFESLKGPEVYADRIRCGTTRTVPDYADKTLPIYCTACDWSGPLKNCPSEVYETSMLTDYSCPKCDTMLIIEPWPTAEETVKHGDPDAIAAQNLRDRYEREKLKDPMLLPEIEGSDLKLSLGLRREYGPRIGWLDHDPRYFVISCNGKTIWCEIALSGCLARFHELKQFLKNLYPGRFVSLKPSLDAIDWLVARRPYWDYDKHRDPY